MKTAYRILWVVASLWSATVGAAERAPNIIFILADDLGYGELGSYGQKLIQTPQLDRMAAEGLRFTQFYAGSTVCAPSRSVLMTGQHMGHTRVRGNAQGNDAAQQLLAEDVTVAEVLKSGGYATALVGKWGLGMPGDEGVPNRQGFDYFFGYLSQTQAHNHYPDYLWRNDAKVPLPNIVNAVGKRGGGYATKKVTYSGDLFFEEASRFVEQQKDRPFFLYLALTAPHANNEATQVLGDGNEVPDYGPYAGKDWPAAVKGHAAMVTRMDEGIGHLLARLRELGLAENTLVLFSSDNGPHREGGADYAPEFFSASGPYSGIKRSLTDGGIRVPLIAWWPGRIAPGGVTGQVGYFGDVLATCAEVAGVPAPVGIDGISLARILRGEREFPREHLYWEFYENGVSQALLLDGRWKGIRVYEPSAPLQLFDLRADPAESKDLATVHPEIVARIDAIMKSDRTDNEHWQLRAAAGPKEKLPREAAKKN